MKNKTIIFLLFFLMLSGCSSKNVATVTDEFETNAYVEYGSINENAVSEVKQETENKIIVSGTISMETKNFDETTFNIEQSINQFDGYIQSSNIYKNYKGGRRLNATVRVPSESYNYFVDSLKGLGNVVNYSYTTEDITSTYYDSQTKLISLEAEYEKGLEFYSKAETVQDLMDVEEYLSDLQYEIDSLKLKIKNYDLLTSYSTLDLNVVETEILTNTEENFSAKVNNAFVEGLENFKIMVQDFIVGTAYNFWLLIVLLVVVSLVYVIFRRNRRKKKKEKESCATLNKEKK